MLSNFKTIGIILTVVSMLFMQACSSGSSSNSSVTDTIGFPSDLAIASPFQTGDAAGAMVFKEAFEENATYAQMAAAIAAIAGGATLTDCAANVDLFGAANNADCYGPTITYTNHPDGAPAGGDLPQGDVGIWDVYENTGATNQNACAAEQINQLTTGVAYQANSAIILMASMKCVANVNGITLPLAGSAAVDITTEMNAAFAANGITTITATSALLERQADDSHGNEVWFYTLAGRDTSTGITNDFTFYLKHIDDATGYSGKLSFAIANNDTTQTSNCNDPTLGVGVNITVNAGSILYNKNSSTDFVYRLEKAAFCRPDPTDLTYPLSTTTYDIDRTDTMSAANTDGWADNYNYIYTSFDPTTDTGTLAFAWQAGSGDGNTRVFNADISATTAARTGEAYFGFGEDAGTAASVMGEIVGFICNWAGPNNVHNAAANPIAQYQEMTINASGFYDSVAASLAITYAPENACDYSDAGFTFANSITTPHAAYTNDVDPAVAAFTNDLVVIPTPFVPTALTEVYPTP